MDYNELIKKYRPKISYYASKYSCNLIPKEDFEQELSIRLWRIVSRYYSSTVGPLENFANGVLSLEAKKIRYDLNAQHKFEDSIGQMPDYEIVYTFNYLNGDHYENYIKHISQHLSGNELIVFNTFISKLDSCLPIRYNSIASSLGITLYDFKKALNNIRCKIKVMRDNVEYF